jgi:hypothetical protein
MPLPLLPVFISVALPTVIGCAALLAGGEEGGAVQAPATTMSASAPISAVRVLADRTTNLDSLFFIGYYGHSTRTSTVVPRPAMLELDSRAETAVPPLKATHCSLPYVPLPTPASTHIRQLGTEEGQLLRHPSERHTCSATRVTAPKSPDFICVCGPTSTGGTVVPPGGAELGPLHAEAAATTENPRTKIIVSPNVSWRYCLRLVNAPNFIA